MRELVWNSRHGCRAMSTGNRFWGVLFLLLAICAVPASTSFAQDASPQVDLPPKSWEGQQTRPDIYTRFVPDLIDALHSVGRDAEKETFHFVILYNVARPNSGSEIRERDLFYGCLRFLLTADGAQSDLVSFVPYQLAIREANVRWRTPFSRKVAEDLYKQIPEVPEAQFGFRGGHNMQAALVAAINDARKNDLLQHTVFIALSEATFDEEPLSPPGYVMKDATDVLSRNDVVLAKANQQTQQTKSKNDTLIEYKNVWRIYLPRTLTPIGTLEHTRAKSVADLWSDPSPQPQQSAQPADPAPVSTPQTPAPRVDWPTIIAGAAGAIVLLAIVGYLIFLFQPRSVTLTVDGMEISGTAKFNKPLYLSDASDASGSVLGLGAVPGSVIPGSKLARIEVNLLGEVAIHSQMWVLDRSPVSIGRRGVNVILKERTGGGMLSGDTINLRVRTNV